MGMTTLALAGVTQLIVGGAFALVGNRLRKRPVAEAARGPTLAFAFWWLGLAVYLVLQGALDVAAVAGWAPLEAHLGIRLFSGPLLCAAVAGLAYHILFILTGRRALAWPVGVYYAVAAVAYDALILVGHPAGVLAADWQVDLVPAPATTDPRWGAVLASIGLPVILCSIAFLVLARRVVSREQRMRANLVGSSMLLWVGSGLLAQLAGTNAEKFVTLVVFGLAAAILVFIAYYPPGPVRRWIAADVRPVGA